MTRYAVFVGANYYPDGGASDFVGFAETSDEVAALVAREVERRRDDYLSTDGWWNMLDLETGAVVEGGAIREPGQ